MNRRCKQLRHKLYGNLDDPIEKEMRIYLGFGKMSITVAEPERVEASSARYFAIRGGA